MKILLVTNPQAEGVKEIASQLSDYGEILDIVYDKRALSCYENMNIDLVVSDRTNFIFPKSFLNSTKTCINTHPSLLPDNRGSYPVFWACILGQQVGVSIHLIDEGIDTGPIIYQFRMDYDENETFRAVHYRTRQEIIRGLKIVVAGLSKSFTIKKLIQQRHIGGAAHKKANTLELIDKLPLGWDTSINSAKQLLRADLDLY
jgi:methionyl-tRNA formyltransferase